MATTAPTPGRGKGGLLLLVGVVGVIGGIALLGYGLAPAKDLWEAVGPAFNGGPPPEDLSERMDAAMTELKGRVLVDGFGFLALMMGIILVKQALSKPRPPPVEEVVQAEVARRLAAQGFPAHGAVNSVPMAVTPAAGTPTPEAAPLPPLPPSSAPGSQPERHPHLQPPSTSPQAGTRRTHCASCGSVLVAGGRICPRGHAQA